MNQQVSSYHELLKNYHQVIRTKWKTEEEMESKLNKQDTLSHQMFSIVEKMKPSDQELCRGLQWQLYEEGLK